MTSGPSPLLRTPATVPVQDAPSPAGTAAAPRGGTAGGASAAQRTEKAAEDFEALLLQQMFHAMWAAVPKGAFLSGGREEEMFRDMLERSLAESVAANQSLGIKEIMVRDMDRTEAREARKTDAEPAEGTGRGTTTPEPDARSGASEFRNRSMGRW